MLHTETLPFEGKCELLRPSPLRELYCGQTRVNCDLIIPSTLERITITPGRCIKLGKQLWPRSSFVSVFCLQQLVPPLVDERPRAQPLSAWRGRPPENNPMGCRWALGVGNWGSEQVSAFWSCHPSPDPVLKWVNPFYKRRWRLFCPNLLVWYTPVEKTTFLVISL